MNTSLEPDLRLVDRLGSPIARRFAIVSDLPEGLAVKTQDSANDPGGERDLNLWHVYQHLMYKSPKLPKKKTHR